MFWIRRTISGARLSVNSCSRIRGTFHPFAPSIRPTKRSRALLAEGFFYYSPEFECLRHPPQKTTIYENTLMGADDGLSALVRRPPNGRRRVVVAVVCPGAPYGPPFTEIARDDVIRLFPTESSFDIGPFSPAAIVPRSRSSRRELRAKRKIQEIPSQLGFSYRVSSIGCRLCVTRLSSLEKPRFVKDEASSLQGPSRSSLRLRKGRLPLHPRPLNGPTTIKTLLIK